MIKKFTIILWLTFSFFIGNAQTYFSDQQEITRDIWYIQDVFTSDIDGDGDKDVLSASSSDNKVAWYENADSLGTFGAQQIISTDVLGASLIWACDLDGDNDQDVISASYSADSIVWEHSVIINLLPI